MMSNKDNEFMNEYMTNTPKPRSDKVLVHKFQHIALAVTKCTVCIRNIFPRSESCDLPG